MTPDFAPLTFASREKVGKRNLHMHIIENIYRETAMLEQNVCKSEENEHFPAILCACIDIVQLKQLAV